MRCTNNTKMVLHGLVDSLSMCFVAVSDCSNHFSRQVLSRTRKPILKAFGSMDNPDGLALHSRGPVKIGLCDRSAAGRISNEMSMRTNVIYISLYAKCEPVHIRDPAPKAKCGVPDPSGEFKNRSGLNSWGDLKWLGSKSAAQAF
jgi:hypothetical protein